MTRLILSTALVLIGFAGQLSAKHVVANDDKPLSMGCHFVAYPITDDAQAPKLTPAPKGYEPFHMEHYGRHGSRWLGSMKNYNNPLSQLRKAKKAGKLTKRGLELYQQLSSLSDTANGHAGDITMLGHRQHREIASRMVRNFPEIFRPGTYVDAKSSMVIRCILSMSNALQQIERMVPDINVKFDASKATYPMLNCPGVDTVGVEIFTHAEETLLKDFDRTHYTDHSHFINTLFNDPAWAEKNLKIRDLSAALYDVTVNTQSLEKNAYDFFDIFSKEELRHEWAFRNARWYIKTGNTPLTKYRMPYATRQLLANIITSADTAMVSSNISANMRFGHDSTLLPLYVMMELDGSDYDTDDLTTLDANWDTGYYVPKAGNMQIIFYRPKNGKKGDILIKTLINEKEVVMPVKTNKFPYYKWSDVRQYYKKKLNDFPSRFADIEKTDGTFTERNFID